VRVICDCGACREIEPEALARLVGWSTTLKKLALRMRCSRCGKKLPKWWRLRDPVARGTEESTLTKTRPKAAPSWGSSGGLVRESTAYARAAVSLVTVKSTPKNQLCPNFTPRSTEMQLGDIDISQPKNDSISAVRP